MPKEQDQDDDWDWHAKKPKQYTATHATVSSAATKLEAATHNDGRTEMFRRYDVTRKYFP
jgi:hypothetical protein